MGKEQNNYSYCQVIGATDVGCKRSANEDFLGTMVTDNGVVAVVCDGMGGHVGGAVASRTAVNAILEFLKGQYFEDPYKAIIEAINAANKAILYQASIKPELHGMGSTCVLLLVRDGKVYIGSVGDSRVYLVRNRRITQLTKDQSYVQMLVDMGQLTTLQAERHPRKNEITNALGLPDMKEATVLPEAFSPLAGDCFLLCSDGLSGMVSNHEIEKIVSRQQELSTQERAEQLIIKAREEGGLDNITVQLVEFSLTPNPPQKKVPSKKQSLLLLLILAIVGIAAYCILMPESNGCKAKKVERRILPEALTYTQPCELLEIIFSGNGTTLMFQDALFWTLPAVSPDSIQCKGVERIPVAEGVKEIIKVRFQPTTDTLSVVFKTEQTDYLVLIPILKQREIMPDTIPAVAPKQDSDPILPQINGSQQSNNNGYKLESGNLNIDPNINNKLGAVNQDSANQPEIGPGENEEEAEDNDEGEENLEETDPPATLPGFDNPT